MTIRLAEKSDGSPVTPISYSNKNLSKVLFEKFCVKKMHN
tara:strand:- start:70 stop:189 length:120 start_codon:yes stop_codon:yes gene_type:complete